MNLTLGQIAKTLNLELLTRSVDWEEIRPTAGYTSDMLSCVMAGAPHRSIWITLQAHLNIIAVAALLELSAIIITEGAQPEPTTIEKANEKGVVLFSTKASSFEVAGRLWEMGLRAVSSEE